jgi:heterodisulfide reductase subunit B
MRGQQHNAYRNRWHNLYLVAFRIAEQQHWQHRYCNTCIDHDLFRNRYNRIMHQLASKHYDNCQSLRASYRSIHFIQRQLLLFGMRNVHRPIYQRANIMAVGMSRWIAFHFYITEPTGMLCCKRNL